MSYIVAHCRKVQTAVGLAAVGRHNCREAVYDEQGSALGELPDYITHPERAFMNEGDRCGASAILKNRSERIRKADLARKPQKNAANAIEFNISASADWFEGRKPDEWQKYFKDARKFLAERYGKENLLHWAVHYDETSPHMHVLMTPIIEAKDGSRYSSANFLGGRTGLRDLHDEIAATVGAKYGLERGVKGSEARHTDQYEWMKDNAKTAKELEKREKALAVAEESLKKIIAASKDGLEPFMVSVKKETKKKLLAPTLYETSDGQKLEYGEYKVRETALQAVDYAKKAQEVISGLKATLEITKQRGESNFDRIQELERANLSWLRATPQQLRDLADKREADQTRTKERDRGNER